MTKNATAVENEPIELRPRTIAGGRIDMAAVRWAIEHMHDELAGTPEMGRVRNALAIALMELDRAQKQSAAIITDDLGWSRYFPWTKRP